MSVGSQIGFGGAFLANHGPLHSYEVVILAGSGLLLGRVLHYVSNRINCRASGGNHDHCAPVNFPVGWIFTIAVALYAANVAFDIISGHGVEPHRFT